MNLDKVLVVDIECDGLLNELTKCHVLSCAYKDEDDKWQIISTNKREDIQRLVGNPDNVIVGHYFVGYDKPALQKLGYEFNAQIIDTLGLSWYLYNEYIKHGLEDWGERLGIKKPEIENWTNLSYEEYKHRCEEDVKINTNLWVMMLDLLRELYDYEESTIVNVVKYFTFKMECLAIQEANPILIDLKQCEKNLEILEGIIEEKQAILSEIMPQVPKYAIRTRPKVAFKKDGSLSASGEKWFDLLEQAGLPQDYDGEVKVVVKYDPPNPASTSQMKDYLLSLGWKPKIFKDGANGKVPQLRDDDKNLCPNIKKLIATVPELEALNGLSVAQHRAGYLKAFLNLSNKEGYAVAKASGFAKTLRLKHSNPFVNLPKPTAEYGEYVRSVMIAPPGKVLIGSDVSSLEDKTKQIAIYDYDSEYVEQMNFPGWDAHLDIGQRAKLLTESEVMFFRWFKKYEKSDEETKDMMRRGLAGNELLRSYDGWNDDKMHEEFVNISKKRAVAKTVNYACLPEDNTEVLTPAGWKSVDGIKVYDKVLSYNQERGVTEFTEIEAIHRYKDAEVFRLSNKWWSVESTGDHRWFGKKRVFKNKQRVYEHLFMTTSDINSEFSILNSAPYEGSDVPFIGHDEASLLGWIASDGYLKWSEESSTSSTSNGTKRGVVCSVAQSKKKYYTEVKSLLDRLGVEYSEFINNAGVEYFKFSQGWARDFLTSLYLFGVNKHDIDWVQLVLAMDKPALSAFFTAFFKGDGSYKKDSKSLIITQNEGRIMDGIILCGNLLGYRTTHSLKHKSDRCYEIRFSEINYTTGQKLSRDFSRLTDVFCLTTSNSTFIIRQNGIISITGNCTYGAGAAKVAESAGISENEARKVVRAYWDRNWAVKQYAEDRVVKTINGKDWIYNPYSQLWLYLTSDHIKFSACNQNAGVKMFDLWVYFMIQEGLYPSAQFHDEVLICVDEGKEEWAKGVLIDCMDRVNHCFNYPIKLEVDVQFGKTYADVH